MEDMSFEMFKSVIEESNLDRELSYFAVFNSLLIGMSTTSLVEGKANVMLTGVIKEYQNKGIAFKLKESVIMACKRRGFHI